ncbi:hypothetical protein Ddye_026143 [Dipteronia dyeriana]|uniref:Reverse transcriptase domain-containing protein n=1 Tax=Dipteronia dyeriana TaxID=168575 RepID=A0AAD9TMG2_9ROSI|nr:hypothetical protein Ddye_026143 [Dipteronia dyeriana]
MSWDRLKINKLNLKKLSTVESDYSSEEVNEALCSCDGNKAPSPDGLNLNFSKLSWEMIHEDFMNFIHDFHRYGSIVKKVNNTFIILILKVKESASVMDFKPISLVGTMYKILAKVLANRLKGVMNSVIGESPNGLC